MNGKQLLQALVIYDYARSSVIQKGFSGEVEWQRSLDLSTFSEQDLLREGSWVILCSGFREATIRRIFDYVSLCFCDWESSVEICRNSALCKAATMKVFANEKKLDAILDLAQRIAIEGFANIKHAILADPVQMLSTFSFLGPVTALHLAKNLGLDVAKPDRHLVRLSEYVGFSSVEKLCKDISEETGDRQSVVDLVLWRYLAGASADSYDC